MTCMMHSVCAMCSFPVHNHTSFFFLYNQPSFFPLPSVSNDFPFFYLAFLFLSFIRVLSVEQMSSFKNTCRNSFFLLLLLQTHQFIFLRNFFHRFMLRVKKVLTGTSINVHLQCLNLLFLLFSNTKASPLFFHFKQ